MELFVKDIEELKELIGKNAIVIFSNGQIKAAELPTHGQVEITSHDNKVKSVEQKVKHLF